MLQPFWITGVALSGRRAYAPYMSEKKIGRDQQSSVGVHSETREKFKKACEARGWQLGPTADKLMRWFITLPQPVQDIILDRISLPWGQMYATAFDEWCDGVRSSLPAGQVKVVNTMSKRGRASNSGTAH
jgi:hypothetical protein